MMKRIEIVLSLSNIFDYEEFKTACHDAYVEPMSLSEYAHKTGLLEISKLKYPNEMPLQGYLKLVDDVNVEDRKLMKMSPNKKESCGSCGKTKDLNGGMRE